MITELAEYPVISPSPTRVIQESLGLEVEFADEVICVFLAHRYKGNLPDIFLKFGIEPDHIIIG
jgi:hypothetical protein